MITQHPKQQKEQPTHKLIICPHDKTIIHVYWAAQALFDTHHEEVEQHIYAEHRRTQLIIHRLDNIDEAPVLAFAEREKQ